MRNTIDIELLNNEDSQFVDYYYKNDFKIPIRFLNKFNKINVLVGANNSGKSRFIRGLMNIQELKGIENIPLFLEKLDLYNKEIQNFNFKIKVPEGPIHKLISEYGKDIVDKLRFSQNEEFTLTKIDKEDNIDTVIKNLNQFSLLVRKISILFDYFEKHKNINNRIPGFIGGLWINGSNSSNNLLFRERGVFMRIQSLINELVDLSKKYKNFNGKRIYIPTLRTAHSLFRLEKFEESKIGKIDKDGINITNSQNKKIREDFFLNTVRKNYKKLNSNVEIFTGLSLYNEIVNVRNSIKEERTKFHDFETFLSINFFEGDDVDIVAKFNINNSDNGIEDDDLIKIYIGGKSRELHNLGDGIQSLIILMYKIFLAENNSMIFIDEPELNLHPGYQRLFLEQITSNIVLTQKNLTYVIVTHSNHFLDLTLEKDNVSIYSFNSFQKDKEQKFIISNVNIGDNQVLRDLGVNNSSVFLANSSIWVEGISDRNFIKAFLLAYCDEKGKPKPREDIDFAFFEYAGSNLVHYNFKKGTNDYNEVKDLITSYALNNNIFLVSDLDFGKEAKHKNIQDIAKSTKGFEYKTTKPYREIENMLSDSVWEKVLINFCNKKDVKTNKENIQKRIKDSISKVKSKEYKGKYIGEFLRDLKITEMNSIYKIDDKKEPGTFIPKAELSQIVLEKVRSNDITWEDFSDNETIVDLTKSIYDFIQKAKN